MLLLFDLQGSIATSIILAFLLTFLLGPILAARYRKALLKHMQKQGEHPKRRFAEQHSTSMNSGRLSFRRLDKSPPLTNKADLYARNRSIAMPFLISILTYGFIASLTIPLANQAGISVYRIVMLSLTFSLPGFFFVVLKYGLSRRRVLLVFLLYFLAFYILYYISVDVKTAFLRNATILLLVYNFVPVVLYWGMSLGRNTLAKQYAFLFLLSVGAAVSTFVYLFDGKLTAVFGSMEVNTALMILLVTSLVLLVLYLFFIKFLVGLLSEAYRRKNLSDWMLQLDFLVLLVAVGQAMLIAYAKDSLLGLFGTLLGFVAYLVSSRISLKLMLGKQDQEKPIGLLLLRVFGHRRRSERLFKDFTFHWQFYGPIHLIAAPDLALQTLEPHEFLDFASGNLQHQFIKNQKDLTQRLQQLDEAPDPDGRYRINEMFCYDEIWKDTVISLLDRSSTVLMDLRSFSAERGGATFEIKQLLRFADLGRVVFLIDESTDQKILRAVLEQSWKDLPLDAFNFNRDSEVNTFYIDSRKPAQLESLKQHLHQMAS